MNKKFASLAFFILGISLFGAYAQESRFFIPSEIRKAYEKGTRSYDGRPGENYWQNRVDYHIKVTLNPSAKMIEGTEKVVYYNSSPDALNSLIVRLYRDAFKKGNARDYPVDARDIDEGAELTDVFINGKSYDLDDSDRVERVGTNLIFALQNPLNPGSELTFQVSWKQKIPSYTRVRTGAYDSTSFFVAYWYPQVSVYDDIFGWDRLNYTLRTEFYNNLGNYEVEITVPNNYLVWATGTFVNPAEVLPEDNYVRYIKAKSSNEVIHIVNADDLKAGFESSNNTWRYSASGVSDFAFALSEHYVWDAAMKQLKSRKVLINSAYPVEDTMKYSNFTTLQQKAMHHFSDDIPGIPYPYETFTTFINMNGSYIGSMEYPMMANNDGPNQGTLIHEMFHTYFPMYVRTNERRWAWMDEGWANYTTRLVSNRYFEDDYEFAHLFTGIGKNMGSIIDLPLITSSQFMSGANYGYASYPLPALVYGILHLHLGDDLFLKCYREYINRWAKKSPTPYDFFYTFENVSDQDLGWLWKPWFFEFGESDIAIESFNGDQLKVIKLGNKPVPVIVEIKYKGGESKFLYESASIWSTGVHAKLISIPKHKNVEKIIVNRNVSDTNPMDNVFPDYASLYKDLDLEPFLGKYIIDEISLHITISQKNGILFYSTRSIPDGWILYPLETGEFELGGRYNIKFVKDESGNCTGLILGDNFYTAKKIE